MRCRDCECDADERECCEQQARDRAEERAEDRMADARERAAEADYDRFLRNVYGA